MKYVAQKLPSSESARIFCVYAQLLKEIWKAQLYRFIVQQNEKKIKRLVVFLSCQQMVL
jgi:hypothetical protein